MDNPVEAYHNQTQRPRGYQLRGDIAISLALHKEDWEGAKLLMDLIIHLEPLNHVDLVLSVSGGPETLPDEEWREFHKKASGFFRKVDINKTPIIQSQKLFVPGTDQASRDWRPTNKTFRAVVDYFAYIRRDIGAFFYLEPDCVPLKRDWFTQLCSEYKSSKKPFMGVIRNAVNTATGAPLPKHMNGSGFYPNPISDHSHMLYVACLNSDPFAVPFDVAGGGEVVPKCHPTRLIYCDFTATPNINPEAVVWHGDKKNFYKLTELEKLGILSVERVTEIKSSIVPVDASIGISIIHNSSSLKEESRFVSDIRVDHPKNAYEGYLEALNQHGHCKASWMRAVKKHKATTKA